MGKFNLIKAIKSAFYNDNSEEEKNSGKDKQQKPETPKDDGMLDLDAVDAILDKSCKKFKGEAVEEAEKKDEPAKEPEKEPQTEETVIEEQANTEEVEEKEQDTAEEDKKISEKTKKISFAALKDLHAKITFDFEKTVKDGEECANIPPEGECIDFEKVFKAANMKPVKNKWSLVSIADFIENLKNEDPDSDIEKRKSILNAALKSDKVNKNELLEDAVRRDKAIDTYEEFLHNRINNRAERLTVQNGDMEKQIRELQEQIQKNNEQIQKEKDFFTRWIEEKEELESRLFIACHYLGDNSAITIGAVTQGAQGRAQKSRE